ncbi:S41 family peptidase [Dysgonomonas sp. GY617]|uniref:S41 family peptidase n=1 Tax=Dysgonomonas sp. GY617 TaxID=2780420 RepID=UPI001883C8A9|nr:S41 family peptidase [Dysgonomonas sp. GY617]MBF0575386.1 S41 family peptidase [Dysgonomonas sp. GY617]
MKKGVGFLVFATFLLSGSSMYAQDKGNAEKRYFEINKNIEVFNSVIKELDMFYVDTLDVEKTIESGIVNMLAGLDPYTNYMTEEEVSDFTILTTGEYAGVGAVISSRNLDGRDIVYIVEPYENMPAAKSGLKVGDIILSINGEDMTTAEKVPGEPYGKTLSNKVTSKLKGQAGTEITVKVERPGVKKPIEMKIVRQNVQISSVPYYGLLQDGVGYIVLTGFTDKCAQDVKNAFLDLKKQGMTSLILDLRGNGGGIMEEAVQLVNFFVPKGQVVLSTKGKMKQWDRIHRTTLDPIDADIPLVVLVDKGSASASEIVSGALQDLDRAVIMGQRTYGKGLVQAPRDLPYGGSLKVTTSKYYIPSGRCIQAIDYKHHNEDGSVGRIPDSLTTVFKTSIGREVRDGGGVTPDIKLEEIKVPSITYYLLNQYIVNDWVTDWVIKNPKIGPLDKFSITDEDYESFKTFVKSKKDFKYDGLSEKRLKTLKDVMDFEGYSKTADEEYKALEAKLVPNLDRDLDNFKDDIKKLLNMEIAKRNYFQKGERIESLKTDKDVKQAIELLNNQEQYKEIFTPGRKIIDLASKTGSEEEAENL